jgi:sulfopyruvate decarboxylase TPP-binding subunit
VSSEPAAAPALVEPAELLDALSASGIDFFTGVPDSLLKDFIAYLSEHVDPARHVTAANEGGAVALAAGYHLATGGVAAVYLQNSGLGNTVNPLVSLADPLVYGMPVLLIVGWRGKPGVHDEPQHRKQGAITLEQLGVLGIPKVVLDETVEDVVAAVTWRAGSTCSERYAMKSLSSESGTPVKKSIPDADRASNSSAGSTSAGAAAGSELTGSATTDPPVTRCEE